MLLASAIYHTQISHKYTHVPSLLNLSHTSHSLTPLGCHRMPGNIYFSICTVYAKYSLAFFLCVLLYYFLLLCFFLIILVVIYALNLLI